MRPAQSLLGSLFIGGIIAVTVFGALILSLRGVVVTNPAELPIPTVTFQLVFVTSTPTPQPPIAPTSAHSPTPTDTSTPTPTICPAPINWQRFIVGPFDTFDAIARRFNLNPDQLQQANCLPSPIVTVAQAIYVPAFRPTPTFVPCYPPFGWNVYLVQYGDTLSGIAARYGMSVYTLMRANCLTTTYIYAGQRLYVPAPLPMATFTPTPFVPTITPTPLTPTPSTPAPWTPTPPIVSLTPTVIPPTDVTPIVTDTPGPTPTFTLPPTATSTPAPTETLPPTSVPVSTPTTAPTTAPTAEPTALPTAIPAPLPTEQPPTTPTA